VRWLIIFSILLFVFTGQGLTQDNVEKELELFEAAEKGDLSKVVTLLNDSINPGITAWDGMTPLHFASQNGHLRTVKALVLNGAKVNAKDDEERSALQLAVHFNYLDIAEFLVQHNADINSKDLYGLTPLFYAAAYGDYIMTDMFLFYSEGEPVTDPNGRSMFLAAVWGGASGQCSPFAKILFRHKRKG